MSSLNDSPLARYTRLLEGLAAAPDGLTLTQIAEREALQSGTVHRLMAALCGIGLAVKSPKSKSYRVGPRLQRLSHAVQTPTALIDRARPILRDLVEAHGETAYLAKLAGDTVESIAMERPQSGDRAYVQPGRIMPIHAAASAKAIFAFQDSDFVQKLLAKPRHRFTADTKMDADAILAELDQVRAERFAVCDNELDPGVLSYAVPVVFAEGAVLYAIGVSGLAERLSAQPRPAIRQSLLQASRILSDETP